MTNAMPADSSTPTIIIQDRTSKVTSVMLLVIMLSLCCIVTILCSCVGLVFASIGSTGSSSKLSSASSSLKLTYAYGKQESTNKILSLDISGVILNDEASDSSGGSLFSSVNATYGYTIKEQLRKAAADDSIKAVVLEVNSPGGTITGTRTIADGIAAYQTATKKPIIAHISGTGASGSYWVSSATDYVTADPGSTIGSIGVIYGPFKYYDKVLSEGSILSEQIITQNGIETRYFTAGTSKDIGSPYRRITEEEATVLQKSVNNEYSQFVKFVATHRNIPENKIRDTIHAMVYDNQQAIDLGLIDQTASREETYSEVAKRAGLSTDDFKVMRIYTTSSGLLSSLLGADSQVGSTTNTKSADLQAETTLLKRDLQNVPLAIESSYLESL